MSFFESLPAARGAGGEGAGSSFMGWCSEVWGTVEDWGTMIFGSDSTARYVFRVSGRFYQL